MANLGQASQEGPPKHWSDPLYRHRNLSFGALIFLLVCGVAGAIAGSIHYSLTGEILTLLFLVAFGILSVLMAAAGNSRWFAHKEYEIWHGFGLPVPKRRP